MSGAGIHKANARNPHFGPKRISEVGLPAHPIPLIGRDKELVEAADVLSSADVHLLTLTGPAGVGKTRLAIELVRRLKTQFRDGVAFVPLATVRACNLVVPTICRALGVREASQQRSFESLRTYLQERQALLLLDNFEQLIGASPLVANLLWSCAGLKVVVTSREPLHVQHEYEFSVPPFAVPDMKNLPQADTLLKVPAVALFIQRARAVQRDFNLTRENARAVAEICARLEGLPLSIELAAARVKLLPPQAMLNRLERRLQLLTSGARDLPVRHQTLRNAIEWSYALLSAEDRRLFRRLAVFVNGFDLEAVQAVCRQNTGRRPRNSGAAAANTGMVNLERLASLLDKSLLQQMEQPHGEPRLMMLETMREYAMECLETSGDAAAIGKAHSAYYLALAEEAEPWITGVEQAPWLDRLETEHDNLRAALQRSLELGDTETALRLSGALWPFWLLRGYVSEGKHWLQEALVRSGAVPSPTRAKALNAAGMLALNQGEYGLAATLCGESLAFFRKLEDERGIAAALNGLGQVALFWKSDYPFARSLYEERLAIFRKLGDQRGIAHSLERLGLVYWLDRDYSVAQSLFEESLSIYWRVGINQGIANSLVGLGHVALSQHSCALGQELYQKALGIYSELRNRPGIARALFGLAWAASEMGDYGAARAQYEDSISILQSLGDKWLTAFCLEGLATVATAENKLELAARLFGAADALRETIGVPIPPSMRTSYDQHRTRVHVRLGNARWAVTLTEGQRLTPEHFVTLPAHQVQHAQTTVARPPSNSKLMSPTGDLRRLTRREIDVLRLAARGLTSVQIARELVISPLTVNVHLRRIYGKLEVRTRSAATRFAVEHNIC